jgi:hypothetical protein
MVKLNLYPFQETTLNLLDKHHRVIVNKSRQMGLSTIISVKILWKMLFNDTYKVAVYANTFSTASEIVDKVKIIYDNLPIWLKGSEPPIINNKKELKLPNNSKIRAFAATKESARSQSSDMVVLDECHFIPNASDLLTAVLPTLSGADNDLVMMSTPSVPSGMFYDYWVGAVNNKNGFLPIELPWSLHPKRTQEWRDTQDIQMGVKKAFQEFNCSFSSSENSVYDKDVIDYIDKNMVEPPASTSEENHEFWYWEYPNYDVNYMVVADTSRGDNDGDYSTLQVIRTDTFTQVAEYQGQIDPHALAIRAKSTAIYYNNALLVVENNGIGEATCLELEALTYDNLYKTNKSSDTHNINQFVNTYEYNDNLKTGFTMSTKTRPLVLSKFQECLINKSITIKSSRTSHELKTFVYINGKAQANRGSNDDLIMPLSIACYLREYALMFASKSVAMSKQLVTNIAVYRNKEYQNFNQMDTNQHIINQYGLGDYDIWN